MWWKPWTWFPVGVRVIRSGRFSREGVALLLAHEQLVSEPRNAYGILLSESTDPENEAAYEANSTPRIDFAVREVGRNQDNYYNSLPEHQKDKPRHGHLWYVTRR